MSGQSKIYLVWETQNDGICKYTGMGMISMYLNYPESNDI